MNHRQGTAGFTLTELLISVVVLVIGVLGFASSVGVASRELWSGQRDTRVAMLAVEQLERLRSLPYDSVRDGSRVDGAYRLDWEVEGADPKRVLLAVTYPLHAGGSGADTLVTYIPR